MRRGQETFEGIEGAIEGNEAFTLMAVIDHAGNAREASLDLAPAWALIFGNPEVGTPRMQNQPSLVIDLPQRILVYEREGKTFIAYNVPALLAERHGLRGEAQRLSTIGELLDKLSGASAP